MATTATPRTGSPLGERVGSGYRAEEPKSRCERGQQQPRRQQSGPAGQARVGRNGRSAARGHRTTDGIRVCVWVWLLLTVGGGLVFFKKD